jgi:hypothetical protein
MLHAQMAGATSRTLAAEIQAPTSAPTTMPVAHQAFGRRNTAPAPPRNPPAPQGQRSAFPPRTQSLKLSEALPPYAFPPGVHVSAPMPLVSDSGACFRNTPPAASGPPPPASSPHRLSIASYVPAVSTVPPPVRREPQTSVVGHIRCRPDRTNTHRLTCLRFRPVLHPVVEAPEVREPPHSRPIPMAPPVDLRAADEPPSPQSLSSSVGDLLASSDLSSVDANALLADDLDLIFSSFMDPFTCP